MHEFETRRITLAADDQPIDLADLADWELSDTGVSQRWAAVQNVSTRTVRYARVDAAPNGTAIDVGHTLAPGAGVVVLVTLDVPFWFWSATGATIAVSSGAPAPTRTSA